MRIAILGTRGIPANYGGFETFAEELSWRLTSLGHQVTVYGRSNFIKTKDRTYRGVNLVILPTIRHKYLDTPVHTLLSTLHTFLCKYDVLLYCNSANSFCTFLPRLLCRPVALNVDGLEWKRAKWSFFGQWIYRMSEYLATFLPSLIVTDARDVQNYYEKKFNKKSTYIPYGALEGRVESDEILKKFGIEKGKYVLYVSRLEPENNAHVVVNAFEKVKTNYHLVIVGDAPYSKDYIMNMKRTNDPRIKFTGYIFGEGYREFQSHAYCYVQATEVGGTHPALVESMGHGNCIIANDVPEHREVLGDAGIYFDVNNEETLIKQLQFFIDHPQKAEDLRKKSIKRVKMKYTWSKVTRDYERLFKKMFREDLG
jgi:glycosyltransferase involved in cell wall biosynthesis